MSLVAGIDLSSNTVDVVLLDEDKLTARWIRHRIDDGGKDLDAFDRARRLRDAMPARTAWKNAGVLAIGIEKPMSRSFVSMTAQTRVQGALLACLPADLPIYELVPARWKKRSIGHGHAKKHDGALWVAQTIRWLDDRGHVSQDAIDAACIAYAAMVTHHAEEGAAAA